MTWVGSIGYYFHYMSLFQHLMKAWKKMKIAEPEQQAAQALRECLQNIPFLEIIQIQPALTSYSNRQGG